jgi:hypothetical protein
VQRPSWLQELADPLPDLEWRLRNIPDSARVRGINFNLLRRRAKDLRVESAYLESFPRPTRFSPTGWYPTKDYVLRLLRVAQLAMGTRNVRRGLSEVFKETGRNVWVSVAQLALRGRAGRRAFLEVLRILSLILPTMSTPTVFGVEATRRGVDIRIEHGYAYFEETIRATVEAAARMCGVAIRTRVEIDEKPFDGRLRVVFSDDDD